MFFERLHICGFDLTATGGEDWIFTANSSVDVPRRVEQERWTGMANTQLVDQRLRGLVAQAEALDTLKIVFTVWGGTSG
jgi:hypothetical protein